MTVSIHFVIKCIKKKLLKMLKEKRMVTIVHNIDSLALGDTDTWLLLAMELLQDDSKLH